jgi:hypothetical protein
MIRFLFPTILALCAAFAPAAEGADPAAEGATPAAARDKAATCAKAEGCTKTDAEKAACVKGEGKGEGKGECKRDGSGEGKGKGECKGEGKGKGHCAKQKPADG